MLGSIDRYLLHFKYTSLKESKFAIFVRQLMKKKLDEPDWVVPKRLPHSFVGKDRRIRRELHELKGIPSIYIPIESQDKDFSHLSFIDSETRWEKDKRLRLLKEVIMKIKKSAREYSRFKEEKQYIERIRFGERRQKIKAGNAFFNAYKAQTHT